MHILPTINAYFCESCLLLSDRSYLKICKKSSLKRKSHIFVGDECHPMSSPALQPAPRSDTATGTIVFKTRRLWGKRKSMTMNYDKLCKNSSWLYNGAENMASLVPGKTRFATQMGLVTG